MTDSSPATRARGVPRRGWGSSGRTSTATKQIWALFDAVPPGVRPAILLGAHAGPRLADAAGLRVDEPLKSETSRRSIPIPKGMAHLLAEAVRLGNGSQIVSDQWGDPARPWTIERAVRAGRSEVGLPDDFRFHDLRHASAKTTVDTYSHLWSDRADTSRAAVAAVYKERT